MTAAHRLVPFPLLTQRDTYIACPITLHDEVTARPVWVELFRDHFPKLLKEAKREGEDRGEPAEALERKLREASERFDAYLDRVRDNPAGVGRVDVLTICEERERVLRAAGIADPYRLAKAEQNATALEHLPTVLAELDAMDPAEREVSVIRDVFAGNIYDLGATETTDRFTNQSVDFDAVRDELKARPWRFDELDAWVERMRGGGGEAHHAAVLFVDNAGPDIVLGMIPFARHLLQRGTRVILTANTTPSLNDVTHAELVSLIEQVGRLDRTIRDALADGRLTLVPSGNGLPLIDLTRVSPELAEAVERERVDLVVLEGMGRSIESNFDATFACESLKLAMLKSAAPAQRIGAEVFDLVCRYINPDRT